MKNFKQLSATVCLLTILLLMLVWNNSITTAEITLPYKMEYKTFQLEVLQEKSAIINYKGLKYLNLTLTTELPMGILYDQARNVVYIAIHPSGSNSDIVWGIAQINVTDYSYKIYRFPWYVDGLYYGPCPWTLTITPDNCIWFSIKVYMKTPGYPSLYVPYLGKLDPINNTLYIYYIPKELGCEGCDIKFYRDYVWYMTIGSLMKINYATDEIVEVYFRDFYDGLMEPDEDGLWISSWFGGFITRFNITVGYFDVNLTGFDHPRGIEIDDNFIYVAENAENSQKDNKMGTIAKVDKKDFSISRINTALIVHTGPFYVLKDESGNLWWTDNSFHVGVFLVNGSSFVYSSKPFCYFMTEVPNGSIWFSCRGSTYVGIVDLSNPPPIPGDVNYDGVVDIYDAIRLSLAFGSREGDANWNADADFNNSGNIDIYDAIILASHFGEKR